MDAVRVVFAVVVVVAFAAFALFLVDNADTTDQKEWERWVYVFGAVEAIAFAAVGWVFGREVNRQRAEKAEERADQAQEKEKQERTTGAKLAGMVIGGGTEGRQRIEAQGESATGLAAAIDFAKGAYPEAS